MKFLKDFEKIQNISQKIYIENWALPRVSIATSVLHSITWIAVYNLFMHSALANQKQDILLSV